MGCFTMGMFSIMEPIVQPVRHRAAAQTNAATEAARPMRCPPSLAPLPPVNPLSARAQPSPLPKQAFLRMIVDITNPSKLLYMSLYDARGLGAQVFNRGFALGRPLQRLRRQCGKGPWAALAFGVLGGIFCGQGKAACGQGGLWAGQLQGNV